MPVPLAFEIGDDMAEALDAKVANMNLAFTREIAAAAVLRDWVIAAGYLPEDDIRRGLRKPRLW